MNLSQLEVFVAVVDEGSLKDAAEKIGLTHSAVSYSLSKLEAELGVTLLERGRHGIVITRIGEVILRHARNIIQETEVIRREAGRERGVTGGKIRFACVPQVPARFLTGIIRDFQHQYPDINVVLFQGSSQEILEWFEEGIIDVGTVVSPNGFPLSVQLVKNELRVLVAEKHPLAEKESITIEDLLNTPLIGTRREVDATSELLQPSNYLLDLQYQVTETATIFAMVAEGMGIAVLPEMLLEEIVGVVSKPLSIKVSITAYLVAKIDSPTTKAFLEVAQDWTKAHGFLTGEQS